MRVAYLGPPGTFSQEALMADAGAADWEPVPLATVYDTVMAVHERGVERALVPIENSLEGSVNATLDALAFEAADVAIVGELVHPVRHCLIARDAVAPEAVRTVVSHPQASAQCARFIRTELRDPAVVPAASTADAVRIVAQDALPPGTPGPHAALGTRLAAELYGCAVLRDGVEDTEGNETRFVWLAPASGDARPGPPGTAYKTSLVFWGAGTEAPGWLVRCLSEFAFRGVNLTRIESRPRKQRLGTYLFFVDCDGRASDAAVAAAVEGLRGQADVVRVLGSYPAAR
jgi:prephenate dehydratase